MLLLSSRRIWPDRHVLQLQSVQAQHLPVAKLTYGKNDDHCQFTSLDQCRDGIIISLMDTFTSFLAGITIFSVLGNLAFETGKNVADVAGGGPGLAFISYPDAIAKFNFVPQVKH